MNKMIKCEKVRGKIKNILTEGELIAMGLLFWTLPIAIIMILIERIFCSEKFFWMKEEDFYKEKLKEMK